MSEYKSFILMDLRDPSDITGEDLNKALNKTALEGLGDVFAELEKTYRLNALYFCAHVIWESGWGTSKLARSKHNLLGLCEDVNFPQSSAYTYDSFAHSIREGAKHISEKYMQLNSEYFHGPNIQGICRHWADDNHVWAKGIDTIMHLLLMRMSKK